MKKVNEVEKPRLCLNINAINSERMSLLNFIIWLINFSLICCLKTFARAHLVGIRLTLKLNTLTQHTLVCCKCEHEAKRPNIFSFTLLPMKWIFVGAKVLIQSEKIIPTKMKQSLQSVENRQ